MSERRTIGLIFGGISSEHDISVQSAARVAEGLAGLPDTSVMPIFISREGKWRWSRPTAEATPAEVVAAAAADDSRRRFYQPGELEFAQALFHLTADEYAANFIILHGVGGEDGRLQGAMELAGLRYTGSGPAASALAMDKARCQALLGSRGLPVPEFVALDRRRVSDAEAAARVQAELGLPCIVKPALGGSSVGVAAVREPDELAPALATAFGEGETVHVERFITGREFTCGVLDRHEPTALPVTEIIPPEGRLFDYEAKYTPGMTREVTTAEIDAKLSGRLQELALETHRAVGCAGFSRVDFMLDAGGPKILEINTIPGMTETSLVPQAAAAAGIDFGQLLEIIIRHAGRREAEGCCVKTCQA